MDTKEKPQEKKAPAKRRPAEAQQQARRMQAPRKRPAPKPAEDEVYVPQTESREERNRPDRRMGAIDESAAAPAKRKAPEKAKKKAGKNREPQYRPYRKANAKQKAVRMEEVKRSFQKFFSSQNPVAKLFYKEDPTVFGADANEVRRSKRAAEKERQRKRKERWNGTPTIYIQPVPFNSRKLAIQLVTVLAVVVAMVLGMSVFFRVGVITVSGANVYSAWTIREKSGITIGDNLLTFGRTKASGQIIANLPYVKSARIGIKLPDTVNIEIEEEAVVYSIQDQDGVWWLINSNGKVVEQISALNAKSYTQVLGVTLQDPQPSEPGVASEYTPTETNEAGEVLPVMITGAQRLNSALKILQALENNDIVGDAASVDVAQLQDIILWYGTQYQVNLGSIDRMEYKITYMKNAIMQMSDYQTGVLDVSFTTWPDMAGYTPFG